MDRKKKRTPRLSSSKRLTVCKAIDYFAENLNYHEKGFGYLRKYKNPLGQPWHYQVC
jgi:hypothetical protein